jgi:hypothetical protein
MQYNMNPVQLRQFLALRYGVEMNQLLVEPYRYSVKFPALATGAANRLTVNVNINSQSDFLLCGFSGAVYDSGLASITEQTILIPIIDLDITDTGSGRRWFDQAQPWISVCGRNGESPAYLETPRLYDAKSSISFVAQSNVASGTYNATLVMHGVNVRLFSTGNAQIQG